MQAIDNRVDILHQFDIKTPEFVERVNLLLEYAQDLIRRMAALDCSNKWIVLEICFE
jgi:hypothetical protein